MTNTKEKMAVDEAVEYFRELTWLPSEYVIQREDPWKKAYKTGEPKGIITGDSLFEYFGKSLDFSTDEE